MKSFFIGALTFLYCSYCSQAQTDTTHAVTFKLGLNYHSHLNYYGRTDSLKSTGFFPLAELWIRKKYYVQAAPVFVSNERQTGVYAGTVATAGYQHRSASWLAGVYFTKTFYKDNAQLVQAAVKGQTGIQLTRLNKVANINLGGDAKFSDQTDFGASAGLDHVFRIDNKDRSSWIIDPSFYTYWGTQQFIRIYNRKQPGFLLLPGNEQELTESERKFSLLSYEISLPVIYVKNNWQIFAIPTYTLPQHLLIVPDRPDLSEHGGNLFYMSIGIRRSFNE